MARTTLLAQLTAQRHWTAHDAVTEFGKTAESFGSPYTVSERQWERWCAGKIKNLPRPLCCRVLESMFGRPVRELFEPPVSAGLSATRSPVETVSGDLLTEVAEESAEDLAAIECAVLGPTTLEQAYDDVVRLARNYSRTPPATTLIEAVRVRRRVRSLLNRTARPSQQHDLYLLLGQLCALMAVTSFDLGDSAAAMSHARTAWGYGEHIDHNGLRAWARGTQSLIAYWDGRPDDAVRLARSGHRYLTAGSGLVRICSIEARACSHRGDRDGVDQALEAATMAATLSGPFDDLHDGVGGEFAFGEARQARCRGTIYIQLGDVQRGDAQRAIAEARRALDLSLSAGQPSLKVLPQVHADMAAAYLLLGNVEGAAEALGEVLDLPVEYRIRGLTDRLLHVRQIIRATGSGMHGSREARQLDEQIREFMAAPARTALGRGASRPALLGPATP